RGLRPLRGDGRPGADDGDGAPLQDAGGARGGSGARAPAGAGAARDAAAPSGAGGVALSRDARAAARGRAERTEGRPQRSVLLRLRKEVQEVLPREGRLSARLSV